MNDFSNFFKINRHNRELNELFPVAYPSMLEFAAVLEELSREKAEV